MTRRVFMVADRVERAPSMIGWYNTGDQVPMPARDEGVRHYWGFLEMPYECCRPEGADGIRLREGTIMALIYPDATGYVLGMLYEHRPHVGYPRQWTAPMDDLPEWLRGKCRMQTEGKIVKLPGGRVAEIAEQVMIFPDKGMLSDAYEPVFAARWWELKMGNKELTDELWAQVMAMELHPGV